VCSDGSIIAMAITDDKGLLVVLQLTGYRFIDEILKYDHGSKVQPKKPTEKPPINIVGTSTVIFQYSD
jgi:hypothetical protein